MGMKSRGVIYILNGPFNFIMEDIHLSNLKYLDKEIVVLDLSSIFGDDIEFLEEYTTFIDTLDERYELYVTGIPKSMIMSGNKGLDKPWSLLNGTWVDRLEI